MQDSDIVIVCAMCKLPVTMSKRRKRTEIADVRLNEMADLRVKIGAKALLWGFEG